MKISSAGKTSVVHHRVRTFFAAVFGTLALSLVLSTLLVVWANRTLTDTNTFVQTVSPLVSQPAIQTFVADKAADAITENVAVSDLAQTLLPPEQVSGKTFDQLTPLVNSALVTGVKQEMGSAAFARLWSDTTRSAHAQLISQLNSNSPTISFDLNPAIVGAVAQLKQTTLAPIADKITLTSTAGTFDLKGGSIDKVHKDYKLFKEATLALVALVLILMGLAIWISVHHNKTLRRMLVGTATISLVLAALIQATSIIPLHAGDPETIAAAKAIAHVLFHNLQVACIIIAIVGYVTAIGSKVYQIKTARK